MVGALVVGPGLCASAGRMEGSLLGAAVALATTTMPTIAAISDDRHFRTKPALKNGHVDTSPVPRIAHTVW